LLVLHESDTFVRFTQAGCGPVSRDVSALGLGLGLFLAETNGWRDFPHLTSAAAPGVALRCVFLETLQFPDAVATWQLNFCSCFGTAHFPFTLIPSWL
jgi:hypothetical protein